MIRTVCTVCEAEIDVPQAGRNACPACGHETVCFAPPAPTWSEAEMHRLVAVVAQTGEKVDLRRGFARGFAAGLTLTAAAYWMCIMAARFLK